MIGELAIVLCRISMLENNKRSDTFDGHEAIAEALHACRAAVRAGGRQNELGAIDELMPPIS